jgi:hypothetical protein
VPVRELVIQERVKNPCATLKQIGDKFGVSREYIRQILSEAGLPTRHRRPGYMCNYCFNVFTPSGSHSILFCNPECSKQYALVTLECESCNKLFPANYSRISYQIRKKGQQHFYCSRRCKGKATGLNNGFSVHPENSCGAHNKGQFKWAYIVPAIKEKYDSGQSLSGILNELHISRNYYCKIRDMITKNT